MRYLPKSPAERQDMLAAIGVKSIDDLFSSIPERYRLRDAQPDPNGSMMIKKRRQINLNPDAAHYTSAQATGVNLYLEIDAPETAFGLRGGVYDLNANLAGTLGIPLSAVVSSTKSSSSK